MGNCGSSIHCGFYRPIACYAGCFDFEPWLDGPHEAVLDYMLARREELTTATDNRIAAINDRAILGCACALRCRQIGRRQSMTSLIRFVPRVASDAKKISPRLLKWSELRDNSATTMQ
jgi:hypothetical protein